MKDAEGSPSKADSETVTVDGKAQYKVCKRAHEHVHINEVALLRLPFWVVAGTGQRGCAPLIHNLLYLLGSSYPSSAYPSHSENGCRRVVPTRGLRHHV
eukprot:3129134-Pleurochrysis_carterae.AAC.1